MVSKKIVFLLLVFVVALVVATLFFKSRDTGSNKIVTQSNSNLSLLSYFFGEKHDVSRYSSGYQMSGEDHIGSVRERIFRENPELAHVRSLRRKALLSLDEKKAYGKLLSDAGLITKAASELQKVHLDESVSMQDDIFRRMAFLGYLATALGWEENPQKDFILQSMQTVLLDMEIKREYPSEIQRSLAGDKVEIYITMLQFARKQAEELRLQTTDDRLLKLLEYARFQYEFLSKN